MSRTRLKSVDWRGVLTGTGVVLVLGLLCYPLVQGSSFVGFIALLVLIFAVMGCGYNVMLGWPNILVFCPSALAFIGGVSSVLLVRESGVPFLAAFLLGGIVAAIVGLAVAVSAVVIGSTFEIVIATLAFEQLVFYVFVNWKRVGYTGLTKIPTPVIGPLALDSQPRLYLFALLVLAFATFLVAVFDRSLLGTLTIATSENEDLLQSIGYNPSVFKVSSIALGSFVLGLGGSMYAYINELITPGSFTLNQTVFLLVIVISGGVRTLHGPILGAVFMVGLPELSRTFGLRDVRPYILGMALILIVLFMPRGILGRIFSLTGRQRSS